MKRLMPGKSVQGVWVAAAASVAVACLVLLGGLMLPAGQASAEPYMAVREGYKCSQCHVNKTGGGARNDYAGVYMQTRMAAKPGAQNDAQAAGPPGRVSDTVSVGADLRASLTYNSFQHHPSTVTFNNQQTSCAASSCHGSSGSAAVNDVGQAAGGKIAEAYMRYQPVPDVATIVYSVNALPTLASRDFYGLIESVLPANGYVKAGIFKLPNGLQNTWDTPFQHYTQGGYNSMLGFETVYASGLEVGIEPGPFSISVSATDPRSLANSPNEKRYFFTASAVGSLGMIGVNYATDPISLTQTRTLTSGFAGTNLGRLTLLGQVDRIDDTGRGLVTLSQEARLGEVDLLLMKGHNLKYLIEFRDPDTAKTKDSHDRQSLIYEPFLTPYLQLRFGYRVYEGPEQANTPSRGEQWFGEAHFMF